MNYEDEYNSDYINKLKIISERTRIVLDRLSIETKK
jgi:hypothetical protein